MGFRTVVMLNNDFCSGWSKDPELGEKISIAMNHVNRDHPRSQVLGHYGRVVECVHADTQTLARLGHYEGFDAMAQTWRTFGPSTDEDMLDLLKEAADKLGYRLVKKSAKKA